MKTRSPADRLEEKSPTTLVTNRLQQRYHFSPVVAEALTEDLQVLSHEMNGASQLAEGQILYPAVKADEPAGKALKECQYVMVCLTMFAKSDIAFRQRRSLKALKKHIVHRITEEADAQGAPLTYEDLAWLLFADRKTIGQYIQELRGEGKTIVTRATYTDASATISHHRPIVEQFLLNYTEPEIVQRTNHTPSTGSGQALGRVEGYIKDFLRICVAHRQGYRPEGIRHLTGLSKKVVQKHLEHYAELKASPFWAEHLERKLRFYETSLTAELAQTCPEPVEGKGGRHEIIRSPPEEGGVWSVEPANPGSGAQARVADQCFDKLNTSFGFENMGVVADVLIQRFLAIIEEYAPLEKRFRPYQTLVLAVDKHEKFGYGKRMEQCQLVPVIISLITPEELQELAEGAKLRDLRPRIAARILKEAYDQGGVLPFSTVGLLIGLHSATTVGKAVALFYEENPDVVLPHSGTIFDMGRTLTHKKTSVLLKHQGLLDLEIARRMNHHPGAVARYNNDDERVGQLWEEGKSPEMISFITGLSLSVVQEYIEIRQEMQQQAGKETQET